MSNLKSLLDNKTHCREHNTSHKHTGVLMLGRESISVELFSYDDRFNLRNITPIHLEIEDGSRVSLYSTFPIKAGHSANLINGSDVSHEHIGSTIAVIGPDFWKEGDEIRNMTFTIPNTDHLLRNPAKLEKLTKYASKEDRTLFDIETEDARISVKFGCRYSIDFDDPIEYWPFFEIDLKTGFKLSSYFERARQITTFFSALTCKLLRPTEVRICKQPLEQQLSTLASNLPLIDHEIHQIWAEAPPSNDHVWAGYSFAHTLDDEELESLKGCLSSWIERYHRWRNANNLMMESLRYSGEISAERLLAAFRWLEEIPLSKAEPAISDNHVNKIAQAAAQEARILGYEDIQSRIAGSIKNISRESHRERFTRLAKTVNEKIGKVFDDKSIKILIKAVELRGRSAHGLFYPEEDEQFRTFARSIFAVEALCYLLTIEGLPIHKAGLSRARGAFFVHNFVHRHY